MTRPGLKISLLPCGVIILSAAASFACGGGSPPGSPTPAPSTASPAAPGDTQSTVCSFDLDREQPDSLIYGADAGDFLADRFSLASGDFNGDGLDDLLLGAPLADGLDNSRANAGEAYVLFGAQSPDDTIDLADGADLTVYGESADSNLGFTVASGDVNGDGVDDVLLGARFASYQGRSTVGKAYVVYGGPGLQGALDTGQEQQDVTIVGRDAGDFFTIALAAGDATGDGIDDVIAGASAAAGPSNDRIQAGEVYVVAGSQGLGKLIDLAAEPPFFVIYGATAGDSLPNHAAAGDLDGDGKDELVLGAPFAEKGDAERVDAGEVYIVDVPEGGGDLDLASGQGFSRLTGAQARDGFGHFTAAADVNGDGLADAIIGARDADGPSDSRNNAGEVHVLYGEPELPQSVDLAQDSLDVTILGVDAGDSLGFTVASGDLNGDGLADILAGAPIGDSCGNQRGDAGEAYAVFGRRDLGGVIDLAAGEHDASVFGAEGAHEGLSGDELGFSLGAGDVNGDGKDDIIAGALLADGPDNARQDAGEAYIILSR